MPWCINYIYSACMHTVWLIYIIVCVYTCTCACTLPSPLQYKNFYGWSVWLPLSGFTDSVESEVFADSTVFRFGSTGHFGVSSLTDWFFWGKGSCHPRVLVTLTVHVIGQSLGIDKCLITKECKMSDTTRFHPISYVAISNHRIIASVC